MEHQIAYSELSDEARRAWETISGLPLTTSEQHRHAWDILCGQLSVIADDPQPSLHVITPDVPDDTCELYVTGAELAALRVMIAWLKGSDRAGRMRDLPIYPDLAEAIVSQLGPMPWPNVWQPSYLHESHLGGSLVLRPRGQVAALADLLTVTLEHADRFCLGWPEADRAHLLQLLRDIECWLGAMLTARDHETTV